MRKIYVQAARSTRHTTPQQQQHMQHSTEQQDEKRSENEKRSGCRLCVCTSTTLYWTDLNALPLMAAAASDASTALLPLTFGPFEPLGYALPQGQRSAPHIFGRMPSPKFGFKTSFFKLSQLHVSVEVVRELYLGRQKKVKDSLFVSCLRL